MFFYVDESGQTGVDLFNKDQPILYYGVLSSRLNIDVLAEPHLAALRRELGVDHLHAVDLGNVQLARVADRLVRLQKSLNISFDLCKVVKRDHAIISFFDHVFDQGVNPGVGWLHYWSPLRYVMLLSLARLFDEDLAKLAWKARTNKKDSQAQADMVTVCRTLLDRIHIIRDARFVEVASGALRWAEANPAEILYNASDKAQIKQISPNLIGFQSVLMRIADRLKKGNARASRIVVDEQSEFNGAQKILADFYANARGIVDTPGPGMPAMDFRSMPDIQIEVPAPGTISAGLELVDIHLWVFKRFAEGKDVAPELLPLIHQLRHRAKEDEVSLKALAERWIPWFHERMQGQELPAEAIARGKELREILDRQRLSALEGLSGAMSVAD